MFLHWLISPYGREVCKNLLQALEQSKKTTLSRFLYALGIREIGEASARVLAEHFGDIEAISNATVDELMNLEDMGPVGAGNIVHFCTNP